MVQSPSETPNITGLWKGHDEYVLHGKPAANQALLEVEQSGDLISGTLKFNVEMDAKDSFYQPSNGPQEVIMEVKGEWYQNKLVQLTHKSNDPELMLCGASLLELMQKGTKLMGKFVAYGPESNKVFTGTIILLKQE